MDASARNPADAWRAFARAAQPDVDRWQAGFDAPGDVQARRLMALLAANRVGRETAPDGRSDIFYGRSFIADHQGEKVAEMDRTEEGVRLASFDLDDIRDLRRSWGVFRDRRPELYGALLTLDGETRTERS